MKKLKLLFALFSFCFYSCCDNNEESVYVTKKQEQKTFNQEQAYINFKALYSKHHTISSNEAEQMAIAFANKTSKGDVSLKSNHKPSPIKDVKVIKRGNGLKSSTTKSDTLAYIVNFGDNNGFAIIAADDRVCNPVLAITENGNYDEDYINENIPALGGMINEAFKYVDSEIEKFESQKDSLLSVADSILKSGKFPKLDNSLKAYVTGSRYVYITEYESPNWLQTTWGQNKPYNDSVPICPNNPLKKCKAGCMATAVAQVMAYWKYPASIYGYTFNWTGMTSEPNADSLPNNDKKDVSYLFKLIGLNIQMNYGCDESGTTWTSTKPWLQNVLGYNVIDEDYSWTDVYNFLILHAPVIITATDVVSGGHAWVLDGYQSVFYNYENYILDTESGIYYVTSSTPVMINYIHNNWGWDGLYNGYFQADSFCTLFPRNGTYYDGDYGNHYYNFTENKRIHVISHVN